MLFALALSAPSEARPPGRCPDPVTVGRGDTLSGIARRCGTSVAALLRANPALRGNAKQLRPGAKLDLPGGKTAARTPEPAPPPSATGGSGYTVGAGDTLYGIAGRLGTSVDALLRLNPGLKPSALKPGTALVVPAPAAASAVTASAPARPAPSVAPSVVPSAVTPRIAVSGSGFPPDTVLVLTPGGGAPSRVTTDAAGAFRTRLAPPAGTVPGSDWEIAIVVEPVSRIAAPAPGPAATGATERASPGGAPVSINGTLAVAGADCSRLNAQDGTAYALVGDLSWFKPGERVRVRGVPFDGAACGGGKPIRVLSINNFKG